MRLKFLSLLSKTAGIRSFTNTQTPECGGSLGLDSLNATDEEERTQLCFWLINSWANLQEYSIEESGYSAFIVLILLYKAFVLLNDFLVFFCNVVWSGIRQ